MAGAFSHPLSGTKQKMPETVTAADIANKTTNYMKILFEKVNLF